MRATETQKLETRAKILDAAKQSFKRYGYSGIGIDGLAKNAGVTSGAFYGHFASKDVVFKEAAIAGIQELTSAIMEVRENNSKDWTGEFIDFYLQNRLFCPLEESCAAQSISPEIMRADSQTKSIYQKELLNAINAIADGLTEIPLQNRIPKAWALLSILSGGVTLARSSNDDEIIKNIISGVKQSAILLVSTP